MSRFFWPTRLNPNPTALTRAGRVLHWIGTIIAGAMAALVAAFLPGSDHPEWSGLILVGFWMFVIYFGGRGLRYILSAE